MAKHKKHKSRISNDEQIKTQLLDVKVELKDGVFIFTGPMSAADFAKRIGKPVTEILTTFFHKGKL